VYKRQEIHRSAYEFPQSFLDKLPQEEYIFWMSMQQNEMFLLGMEPTDCIAALDTHDYKALSTYLYRVQKMSIVKGSINIWFRYHLETELDDSDVAKSLNKFHNIRSINAFTKLNPLKIKTNHIGKIINK
jgi:CRISPR-associated endonuclease Csn1